MMIKFTNSPWRYWRRLNGFSRRSLIILFIGWISSMTIAFAQNIRTIQGIVVDQDQNPVENANVVVMGSNIAASTDVNGAFILSGVPQNVTTIVVSKVGHSRAEVTVGNQDQLRIIINNESIEIEETIVVGYGTQKKESLVGAIAQTTGEVLERTGGVTNLGMALTGNLPGLVTSSSSGMPGAEDPEILIRAQTSWNSSAPLILVDGVERSMSAVDIASVESISVLKDASATAVFGVKGANGVILITTKKGKAGKATVQARVNTTAKLTSRLPAKYDAYDALALRNRVVENELI